MCGRWKRGVRILRAGINRYGNTRYYDAGDGWIYSLQKNPGTGIGAGAFSDGKYNITNDFGGTLFEYIGKEEALDLMRYVDEINVRHGGEDTKLYSTAGTHFKKICMQNKLKLLDASVRHLGTDINYVVLENIYNELKTQVDFFFQTPVTKVECLEGDNYRVYYGDTSAMGLAFTREEIEYIRAQKQVNMAFINGK